MATGTPVIATRAGGIPDMIQDDVNGLLVDCGNDPQMAQCIISLLTEPGKRQRIARTGNEMAAAYLPGPIALQHLDVYERLLS
jgi:glycosyltransferase involved in cell wall biosynthesis